MKWVFVALYVIIIWSILLTCNIFEVIWHFSFSKRSPYGFFFLSLDKIKRTRFAHNRAVSGLGRIEYFILKCLL